MITPQATPEQLATLENLRGACQMGVFEKQNALILLAALPEIYGALSAVLADARAYAALAQQLAPEGLRKAVVNTIRDAADQMHYGTWGGWYQDTADMVIAAHIAPLLARVAKLEAALAETPTPEELREAVSDTVYNTFPKFDDSYPDAYDITDAVIAAHIAPLLARVAELERALSSECAIAERLMAEARKNT